MLKNIITNNYLRFTFLALSTFCIISFRWFQKDLFYDPFIDFFELNFQNLIKPSYNTLLLYLSLIFRYFLNSIFSIFIIILLFKNVSLFKFLTLLYFSLFLILILLLIVFLEIYFIDWQLIFYIRRFLIQPILLILFIPGFYFQEIISKKTVNL